jgi:hyperosmotically inducible protein
MNMSCRIFTTLILVAALGCAIVSESATPMARAEASGIIQPNSNNAAQSRLFEQIRRALVTLPYYDVFDWLEADVRPDGTVVLRGEVVRPTTKKAAEARLRDLEAVSNVINEIEVLPVSPNDDRLRRALYRAIYNFNSPLFRYATQAVPPIHIIVKNGRVTLKGVVASEMDKRLAYMAANRVPGVFQVTNELRVESGQ